MRNYFLLAVLFHMVSGGIAYSQNIELGDLFIQGSPGAFVVGGGLEYDYDVGARAEYGVFTIGFGGSLGFFVADGLQIGPTIDFQYTRYELKEFSGFTTTIDEGEIATVIDYSIGFQIGYFLSLPNNDTVVPYMQFSTFLINRRVDDSENIFFNDGDDKDFGVGVRPNIGTVFFVTDLIGISLSAFYEYETIGDDDDFTLIDRDFGLNIGLNLFI